MNTSLSFAVSAPIALLVFLVSLYLLANPAVCATLATVAASNFNRRENFALHFTTALECGHTAVRFFLGKNSDYWVFTVSPDLSVCGVEVLSGREYGMSKDRTASGCEQMSEAYLGMR